MDAIAEHAGAGKATVYRWWPNKAAVLIEAFRVAVARDLPFPNSGSLHGRSSTTTAAVRRDHQRQPWTRFFKLYRRGANRIRMSQKHSAVCGLRLAEGNKKSARAIPRSRTCVSRSGSGCGHRNAFRPLILSAAFRMGPVNESYIDNLLRTALQGFGNKRRNPVRATRKDTDRVALMDRR